MFCYWIKSVGGDTCGTGNTLTNTRLITCLENLEMSGNLTAVREMSGILLKVMEMSGKSCLKLFIVSCIFTSIQALVGVYSVFNIKHMVLDHALSHSYLPLTVTLVQARYE